MVGQSAESVTGRQLHGREQQYAPGSGVRLPATLPCQASAQQSRNERQPALSSCPSNVATLPQQRATAEPGRTGARPQASSAQRALPQQAAAHQAQPGSKPQSASMQADLPQQAAAQHVQPGSKPQSASAPSAATASRGTGVFSGAQGNDSDDNDFMPSKLLADISKAASAPSMSTACHSTAAGPQR